MLPETITWPVHRRVVMRSSPYRERFVLLLCCRLMISLQQCNVIKKCKGKTSIMLCFVMPTLLLACSLHEYKHRQNAEFNQTKTKTAILIHNRRNVSEQKYKNQPHTRASDILSLQSQTHMNSNYLNMLAQCSQDRILKSSKSDSRTAGSCLHDLPAFFM